MKRVRQFPVLGTVLELSMEGVPGATDDDLNHVRDVVVAEFDRLERVFSAHDEQSELSRWRRGESFDLSVEFCELMASAHRWQVRSEGTFNPATGEASAVWARAVETGQLPSAFDLAHLADSIADPRFDIVSGVPVRTGPCEELNVNAIAKGFIVDRALRVGLDTGSCSTLLVNAGGDLRHGGERPLRVGIENPLRPYDNEPPLLVVSLANAGLATSGVARRGFQVQGVGYGHVIDPRTARPVDGVASVTVFAPDAETADVLATAAGVRLPHDAVAFVDRFERVGCLVVDREGTQHANGEWRRRFA